MPCGMASPGCGSSARPWFLMAEPRTQHGAPGAQSHGGLHPPGDLRSCFWSLDWQHVASSPGRPEARGQGSRPCPITGRALSVSRQALSRADTARPGLRAALHPPSGLSQGRAPMLPLGRGHWTCFPFSDWDVSLPVPSAGPRVIQMVVQRCLGVGGTKARWPLAQPHEKP